MNRIVFVLIILVQCQIAHCQKEDLYTFYKTKFPDDPAVFVERSEVRTIFLEGDSLKIVSENMEDLLHLKDQTEAYASNKVYGSYFNKVKDIKAKTLVWDKSRYREIQVSEFKKGSDQRNGIFYDDSYYYSFNFPSIALGNRTQLQYRELLNDPRFMSGFVFSSYLPQGKTSFVIKAPKDLDLSYKVLHDEKNQIHFKKTEKGNIATYEWTAENLSAYHHEELSPAMLYSAPHVVCYVKSYKSKSGRVNVCNTLDDLYKWYYGFIKDLNKAPSQQLSEIVKGLKQQSKTEIDLVRNIFYWVQSNIHYIAFEQGMRGLIPHDGSYVCEKRYGDCKDMANLMVSMLQLAGVKAYHTWIGTRDIPYRYTEFPTPIVDNHMIATYIASDGKHYFLDATSDHTPFGFPSSMIQGKEALIALNEKEFKVTEVPIIPNSENVMTDSVSLNLTNNTLAGKGNARLTGFSKVFGGYNLDRSTEDEVRKYVLKLVGKGNNKFILDKYTVAHLDDRDVPTAVNYNFSLSDYHQKVGDEIFVNLNLNKDFYNAFINLDLRHNPIENDYRYLKNMTVELQVPSGYKVSYLPENFTYDNGKFACTITYTQRGNVVTLNKKFVLNYLLMMPSEFSEWNDAIRKFSNAYKESVILSKIN